MQFFTWKFFSQKLKFQKGRWSMKAGEFKEWYAVLFPEYPDIVTVKELQTMLGISRHLAYDLLADGEIRGIKVGNAYRIPKVNVIRYVMEQSESRQVS